MHAWMQIVNPALPVPPPRDALFPGRRPAAAATAGLPHRGAGDERDQYALTGVEAAGPGRGGFGATQDSRSHSRGG